MKQTTKRVARVFADVGGYYWCDDELPYLDARGCAYETKASAMLGAYWHGFTHAVGSGAYRQGRSIASQIRLPDWAKREHSERNS